MFVTFLVLKGFSYQHVFTSNDPDQLASQNTADLNLHCFKTG